VGFPPRDTAERAVPLVSPAAAHLSNCELVARRHVRQGYPTRVARRVVAMLQSFGYPEARGLRLIERMRNTPTYHIRIGVTPHRRHS
jgi:hypothetical protein